LIVNVGFDCTPRPIGLAMPAFRLSIFEVPIREITGTERIQILGGPRDEEFLKLQPFYT
jgi:hypothetical protein